MPVRIDGEVYIIFYEAMLEYLAINYIEKKNLKKLGRGNYNLWNAPYLSTTTTIFEHFFAPREWHFFYDKYQAILRGEASFKNEKYDTVISAINVFLDIPLPEIQIHSANLKAKILYQFFLEKYFKDYLTEHEEEFKIFDHVTKSVIKKNNKIQKNPKEINKHTLFDIKINEVSNEGEPELKTQNKDSVSSEKLFGEIEVLIKKFCLSISKRELQEASTFHLYSYANKDIQTGLPIRFDGNVDLRYSFIYTLNIQNISFFDFKSIDGNLTCKTYHEELIVTPVLENGDLDVFIVNGLNKEVLEQEWAKYAKYIDPNNVSSSKIKAPIYGTTITRRIKSKYDANLDLTTELVKNQFLVTIRKQYQYIFERIGDNLYISSFKEIKVSSPMYAIHTIGSATIAPSEESRQGYTF